MRYSNVPLEASNVCPNHIKHNKLADEANKRLQQSGPDSAWRIFYYADSIFTGMRNTATPGQPLGINPAEDEWWKIYNAIEYPTASTGNGNWPLTLAGTPQGANVMNPLNAYIFGLKTSENKKSGLEKQGPWAEGNIFDGGLVEGSFGVLNNRSYFESSFRIRGALMPNDTYSREGDKFRKENWSRYLPSPHSSHFLSQGLHTAGRQVDKFFREYASNTIYMRYAPSVYSGSYKRYPQAPAGMYNPVIKPPEGILKRKNAAKDLLRFALWCYVFYFRGSEAQRSLFCHAKSWAVPKTEFTATDEYVGQAIFGETTTQDKGPLTICDVGFDFNEYYSRQNLLAPALGCKLIGGKYAVIRSGTSWRGYGPSVDGTGNPIVEQYRPKFSFMVMQSTSAEGSSNGYLGRLNPDPSSASNGNETSWIANKDKESSNDSGVMVENYDDLHQAPNLVDYYNQLAFRYGETHEGSKLYGKGIRVSAGNEEKLAKSVITDDLVKNVHPMLMKCSYDNNGSSRLDSTKLMYKNISGFRDLESKNVRFVLAGYYLQ
ncbi:MAG TPA: hypothetical protein EYG21_02150, partial [Nitrospinaceae bacterium]|nr:hypothetical protein [Nitrospinaceae bacterium]